jgi:hypothetical protein
VARLLRYKGAKINVHETEMLSVILYAYEIKPHLNESAEFKGA